MKGWIVVDGKAENFQSLTQRDFPAARILDQFDHGTTHRVGLLETDDLNPEIATQALADQDIYGVCLSGDEKYARGLAEAISQVPV